MENKLYKWNKSGSKIIINTGYREFDNYINCISKGNVISRGQLSGYIRPYNKVVCNGITNNKGQLRDYDLNMFRNLSSIVKDYIKNITNNEWCILYQYSTKKGVFGYIVEQNNNYKIFIKDSQFLGNKRLEQRYNCLEYVVEILKEENV